MKKQLNTGEDLREAVHFLANENNRRKLVPVLFCLILVIKVFCMGAFSSDFQNAMFEPFIQDFIKGLSSGFYNPYQSFYEQGIEINFPYPPIMLLIMSVGEGLSMLFPTAPLFIHNILFKLPLLIIDCLVYHKLTKLHPDRPLIVLFAYFASPVIIYATYMHGQLDIVPMSFLFISLFCLIGVNAKRRYILSVVFFALALLCKFHIAAALPLIMIYIRKKKGYKQAGMYGLYAALLTALVILPFWGDGFIDGVLFNTAQSALFGFYFSYGNLQLYLSVAAIVLVYLYVLNLNFINSDLLFGLLGLLFSIFLALCAPMPGWYIWVMFFLADFIIRSKGYKHSIWCFALLQGLYLVFFLFFHKAYNGATDLYWFRTSLASMKIDVPILKNIVFSLLSASLIYMIWLMHSFSVAGNNLYKFHDRSFVLGICGDSSTGKTTLQDRISKMFDAEKILCVEGDGDHKWERGDSNWERFTHLDPRANYLYRQARDICQLKKGYAVNRVEYDHQSGHFSEMRTIYPRRFISVSGLHIFFLPQLRDNIDLKIYMEADDELRETWKLERDVNSRGHSIEEIRKQIESRKEDAQKYIYPQKEYADIIIRYFADSDKGIGIHIKVNTKIEIDMIVDALISQGADLKYEISDDYRYQEVVCYPSANASVDNIDYEKQLVQIYPNAGDMMIEDFSVEDITDCICKLIIIEAINSKLRGET